MLISDYLSSNIIISIFYFYFIIIWPIFEKKGRNIKNSSFVFGSNENFKICFKDLLTFKDGQCHISMKNISNINFWLAKNTIYLLQKWWMVSQVLSISAGPEFPITIWYFFFHLMPTWEIETVLRSIYLESCRVF